MSDYKTKLSDKGFCNWVKASLAISITKAGLQDVVCNKLETIHRTVLDDVRTEEQKRNNTYCFGCVTRTIVPCSRIYCNFTPCVKSCPFHKQYQYRPCRSGICDQIRHKIQDSHKYKHPSWKNTRAEFWCNSYWEYAKCFMPPDGYTDKTSFSETDFNGVVNILMNHNDFATVIDLNVCENARGIVNSVRHNGELSLSDQQFEDVVCSLQQLLTSCEDFKNSLQAADARLKLDQLKDDSITITEGDVNQCLQNQYDALVKDLKQDVIQFIKDQHGTTSISPVLEEVDSPLLDFYVPPKVTSGNASSSKGNAVPSTSYLQSVKDIFYGQNERHREIYLCADAGLGKTVFGKRLALIWCQANEAEQKECNFTEDEEEIMKGFDFVFYISLKEADPLHIDVDDMVQQQIIKNLARASSYSTEFIEKVLTQQTCLIVLDGLDEWSHPKEHIPFRKPRQNCAFFTTTRPWKFTVARIRQSKIDQQLEMKGIDFSGKQKLMSNLLKATFGEEAESETEMQLKGFDEAVNKRNITGFETSPMLLLYLMCLWLDEKPMGDSRCGLYCNIVELLLQKLLDRHPILANQSTTKDLPDCFKETEVCCRYASFIGELSLLAFITLFNKDIENKFVFSEKWTKKTMSKECLEFWLKAGLLTQIKGQRSLTSRDSRVHFIHKTFHEFFAAVHLALTGEDTAVADVVKSCSDLNSVLQYSNFLTFLCGLNPTVSSKVLNGVVAILSKDILTERLRNNTYAFVDYWEVCDLKQKFQNLMVACVNECRDNGYEPRYQLEDVMLNFDGDVDNKYMNALHDLTEQKNVKSVKFGGTLDPQEVHRLVESLEMRDMRMLEKLELWGHPGTADVEVLLGASQKTLKCLLIHGGINNDIKYIEISEKSFRTLETLTHLRCIDLFCITLKHDLIKKLFDWLERKRDMTQIKIARVKCSDHSESSCMTGEFVFDLSGHANLKIIGLGDMFASGVKVNSAALEEFWADSNEPIISSFLTNYITSNLHTFVVEFVKSKETVDQIIGTLPKLDNLCHVQLKGMDLEDRDLLLTNQHTVKHVRLIEITMESQALKKLIEELGKYRHAVTMEIASCDVKKTAADGNVSFEDLRQMIELATDKFTVISNLRCSGHDDAFAFRTIPVTK